MSHAPAPMKRVLSSWRPQAAQRHARRCRPQRSLTRSGRTLRRADPRGAGLVLSEPHGLHVPGQERVRLPRAAVTERRLAPTRPVPNQPRGAPTTCPLSTRGPARCRRRHRLIAVAAQKFVSGEPFVPPPVCPSELSNVRAVDSRVCVVVAQTCAPTRWYTRSNASKRLPAAGGLRPRCAPVITRAVRVNVKPRAAGATLGICATKVRPTCKCYAPRRRLAAGNLSSRQRTSLLRWRPMA